MGQARLLYRVLISPRSPKTLQAVAVHFLLLLRIVVAYLIPAENLIPADLGIHTQLGITSLMVVNHRKRKN